MTNTERAGEIDLWSAREHSHRISEGWPSTHENPETPAGMSTLALRAVVDPPSEQILWYVDGVPFELTDYPYTVRWPLEPGEHTIQARLPHTDAASSVVRVMVSQ